MTLHLRALAVAALLLVLWPEAAQAHARPVATTPADGQVLAEAPATLSVTFDEPVALSTAGNALLAGDGAPVEATFTVRDETLTVEPGSTLARGSYVVAWRVVSADTHPVAGGFTFSVGARSTVTATLPGGAEQREVQVARSLATGLQYAGVLGLAGLVGFGAFVAPHAVRRHDGVRASWRTAALVFAGLASSGALGLVPLTALWESGGSLSGLVDVATWTAGTRGSAAVSALLVTGGSAAALLGARWRRDVVAVGGATLAVSALVVVGHTRSYGPPALVLTADLAHLAAAAAWWGGLVALVLALKASPSLRPSMAATMISRFSGVAAALVAVLLLAGAVLYLRIGHSLAGLWETSYGWTVLVKAAVVAVVLVVGAWNRFRLVPRLPAHDDGAAAATLTRTIRAEALLLVVVVAVTAVLVGLSPPPRVVDPGPAVASSKQSLDIEVGDRHDLSVVLSPARLGVNGVRVVVTDAAGDVVDLTAAPTLSFRLLGTDVGPLRRPVSETASGVWEATVDLPLPGVWEVSTSVPLGPFEEPVVSGEVEVR